jgi:hypothetical protein
VFVATNFTIILAMLTRLHKILKLLTRHLRSRGNVVSVNDIEEPTTGKPLLLMEWNEGDPVCKVG